MPAFGSILSSSVVVPVWTAGAVTALLAIACALAFRRRAGALALIVVTSAALLGILWLDREAASERAAMHRALEARSADLVRTVLAPGSALSCLDGVSGETLEDACEKAVFAKPEAASAAVSYTSARLALLADWLAVSKDDAVVAPMRRALELDRYGMTAHVLSVRDGCTAEQCAAFALFKDTAALKANLKANGFAGYVARHAASWSAPEQPAGKPAAEEGAPPVAEAPQPQAPAVARKYDFPSAASIPPVSIMNAEPAARAAPSPADASAQRDEKLPLPPKRPQNQAAAPR